MEYPLLLNAQPERAQLNLLFACLDGKMSVLNLFVANRLPLTSISLIENQYRIAPIYAFQTRVMTPKIRCMRLYICTNMTENSKWRKFFSASEE